MYARSTTFQARPEKIDEGIAYVRDEVMPAAKEIEGYVGLSMICDRESGRSITTTAWRSQEALRDSEQNVSPMRQRGAQILGSEPLVDRWEIAVLHRHAMTGEGACVRCTWLTMDPGDPTAVTHGIDTYRMATVPRLEEMDGFCSTSLMVDRATGRAVTTTTFANRDAMLASRGAAEVLRARTADAIGARVTDVLEFELVLAHLHVPESSGLRRATPHRMA